MPEGKRGRGRPRGNRTRPTTIRVEPDVWADVLAESERTGRSANAIANDALKNREPRS